MVGLPSVVLTYFSLILRHIDLFLDVFFRSRSFGLRSYGISERKGAVLDLGWLL